MGIPGNQELQVAIDLQLAMENQMSTEKADSLRTPALDRPEGDETTVHADRMPALNRDSGDNNPLNFNNESNINIAVHDVMSTEQADNL